VEEKLSLEEAMNLSRDRLILELELELETVKIKLLIWPSVNCPVWGTVDFLYITLGLPLTVLNEIFHRVPQSLPANVGIVTQIRPPSPPSRSCAIH
jgi:hypothetical protein